MSLAPLRAIVGRIVRRTQIRNLRKKARKANRRSFVVGEISFEIRTARGKGSDSHSERGLPKDSRVVIGWSTNRLTASIFNQFCSIENDPATSPPA
jgi:hypothetical protein